MSNVDTVLITGSTYSYRQILREQGGHWDATAKGWRLSVADYRRVAALIPDSFAGGTLRVEEQAPTLPPAPVASPAAAMVAAILAPVAPVAPVAPAPRPAARLARGADRREDGATVTGLEIYDSTAAALAAADPRLDWSVSLRDLYLADGRKVGDRAVVRDDNERVLGTVGARFRPLQNLDAAPIFDAILRAQHGEIVGAGSFRGGRQVYIQARLAGADEDIGGGDRVVPYLLLSNSHDGSRAIEIGYTLTRVVCQNTLAAALSDGKGETADRWIRVRHIGDPAAAVEEVAGRIDVLRRTIHETANVYRALATRTVDLTSARSYWERALAGTTSSDRVAEIQLARVETLYARGRGALAGSRWGMYNALTEFLSHEKGRDRTRFESNLIGDGAKTNARALALAVAA